jgi:pimeloyl-ACP methyl ester carboxylesterase
MKNHFVKLAILFALSFTLIVSCSKDDKSNPNENALSTAIITHTGGSIETAEGIKITFPINAISVDTEVAIGYTGTEPTTFPNTNVQILGKAFTVKITANSLNQSAILEIPTPVGYSNSEETVILISKQGTNSYYPLFFYKSEGKLIAKLDYINYQDLYPALRSNNKNTIIGNTTLIVTIIKYLQTPPAIEMGLKKVETNIDNTITFNPLPILNKTDKVLIMVHGWISSPSLTWEDFILKIKPRIACAGYTQYLTFGYNSSLSIDQNSTILSTLLKTKTNGATVDIIGHSMGGLVSRSTIENHGCSSIVRNLITLGTPHKGSSAANLRTLLGLALSSNYSGSNFSINTQGLRDLIPSSVFLTNLNDNPAPTTNYYPIAGLINNLLKFDGVVTEASARGIQNNLNLIKGQSYIVPGAIPHLAMTNNDDPIILNVAERLNTYNKCTSKL